MKKDSPISISSEPWSQEEESIIVKKIDRKVLLFLAITYFFAFLARVNMGNAKIANLETKHTLLHSLDIDMSKFLLGIMLFFIPYVLFEIPSNMISKSVKSSRYFAFICFSWGIVAVCSALLKDFMGFAITRVILGTAESGFVPGSVFYLSTWYKPREQGLRFVLFFSSATIAGVLGGILAFTISLLNNVAGLRGWQWIFIIEGAPSLLIAFLCLKYLPDNPATAYFLTDKEKFIASHRIVVKADASSFSLSECLIGLFHPRTLAFGIMGFCTCTPMYSFSFLMPTLVSNLGYSSLTAQLLSSPPFFFGYFFSIAFAYHSDKTMERKFHLAALFAGFGICFMLMTTLTGLFKYAIINVCVCFAISGLPVALAWHNEVLGPASKTTKAATSGMIITLSNIGGILAPLLYKGSENFGNTVNASLGGIAIVCILFVAMYIRIYKRDKSDSVLEEVNEEVKKRKEIV